MVAVELLDLEPARLGLEPVEVRSDGVDAGAVVVDQVDQASHGAAA